MDRIKARIANFLSQRKGQFGNGYSYWFGARFGSR